MSQLLPIIEILMDSDSDQERADWLLRCPLSVLMTYQATIRQRLAHAGFHGGVAYLEGELVALRGVRCHTGDLVDGPRQVREAARLVMMEIAYGPAVVRGLPALEDLIVRNLPDHSITEL